MLFLPRQVALASSSRTPAAAVAMAKEDSKKEKKSKSKAAAKAGSAAAPDARAVVVASVAAFLEAGGFPRALAALQSEANIEEGSWKSSAVSLEDLVSKFLESSRAAAETVTAGSNEQGKATDAAAVDAGKKKKNDDTELKEADASAPSAVQEDETKEKKKKKKKKGDTEASEPETKVIKPSADEKPAENTGAETKEKKHKKKKKDDTSCVEDKEAVKTDDQKVDGGKKKSKKQEEDDEVEARLEKASLAIQNKLEAAEKLIEGGEDGAVDKTKKKKKGKSAETDGAKEIDGVKTVEDDNEKKAKKKRKKSDSEENLQEQDKEVAGKGSDPKSNDQDKSETIEEGENGRPSSENAVVGKKRKLEQVEESKSPATENGTANQTPSNGFAEDHSKENSTVSKPSKRQKKSDETKTVTPFQRVKLEAVKFADERLQDNSYWAKGGAETGYGAKAQEILGQVRGRGFRHEKTKKKRGTYRGGQIDLGTHSIKFDNSDDE